MDLYPRTLPELEKQFSTEEACRQYLFELRWPEGFRCPRCGGGKAWPLDGGLHRCAERHYKASVTAGTIFEGTRKPLTLWFRAVWLLTSQKNGASALGIQRVLGLGSYETAWMWLHKLRRAMVRPGRERLVGEVEVDETYVGGERPGKRGRGASGKALVVIAVEVNEARVGRIRLRRVADASGASLEAAIREFVQPNSVIRTDGWSGYGGLKSLGYAHEIARREADVGDNLLPHCHRVAALMKRWLLGTYQGRVSPEHLDYYLDEFAFRFNRRTSRHRGQLFYRLLQQAVATEPSPYARLQKGIGGSKAIIHNM